MLVMGGIHRDHSNEVCVDEKGTSSCDAGMQHCAEFPYDDLCCQGGEEVNKEGKSKTGCYSTGKLPNNLLLPIERVESFQISFMVTFFSTRRHARIFPPHVDFITLIRLLRRVTVRGI